MSTTPTSFSTVADFDKYLEQVFSQIQMPSKDSVSQMIELCLATIGQYMDEAEKLTDKLSLKQIALLYIYNGKVVEKSEANVIALEHKHKSGSKLYDHYRVLMSTQNRTAVTGRKATCLLTDIAAIKPRLEGKALAWAEQDEQKIKLRRKAESKE